MTKHREYRLCNSASDAVGGGSGRFVEGAGGQLRRTIPCDILAQTL